MSIVNSSTVPSTRVLYLRILVFSVIVFGLCYLYTSWLKIPGVLNKSVADTAVVLIGLSMLLSGLAYFWNLFDSMIIYRKYLGLVGWAYGIVHVVLSRSALNSLLLPESWEKGVIYPALTGLLAIIIFTIMAIISNTQMARALGGTLWRLLLRTGYLAVLLVLAHVVLLKANRWITWYQQGMQTPPSLSFLISLFMLVVIGMRIVLSISAKRKKTRQII